MSKVNLKYGRAICYSGYREGQSPLTNQYPSYEQIKEDLFILKENFDYIRMYDPSLHAKTVLKVIKDCDLKLKVVLGADLIGEVNNPNCPWDKRVKSEEELADNKRKNIEQINELIKVANEYEDIIVAVSCGNENVAPWNSRLVHESSLVAYATMLKTNTKQLVTFCEGPDGWLERLPNLTKIVDFISIHSYPLWQGVALDKALQLNIKDYLEVSNKYPDKLVIFTEAGWASESNGRSMNKDLTNEENQKVYIESLLKWSKQEQVTVFLFEAFDEPWKGSNDPLEPEKHWGIYKVSREPKLIMKK